MATGQNLIPNGSFEEFIGDCEFGLTFSMLQNWERVECAEEPAYPHMCYDVVPHTALGFQYPEDGSAFIAILTARFYSIWGLPDGNPQTYATVNLADPLVAGEQYCLRLWANLADSSNYRTGALHAFFSYGVPSVCNYNDTMWDTHAAVTFDISQVDTAAWTMLEVSFTASGGESNLTLGAFQTIDEIDTVFLQNDYEQEGMFATYFIDNVELWACEVGVGETTASAGVKLYPDPVQDVLSFTILLSSITAVEVLDAMGRSVLAEALAGRPFGAGRHEVDVSRLAPGRYVLRMWMQDGGILTEGFVVVR